MIECFGIKKTIPVIESLDAGIEYFNTNNRILLF
jgi:hypothetical protein